MKTPAHRSSLNAGGKHIVIDARIRRASTGRPVDRLLAHLPKLDTVNRYTVLLQPDDDWRPPVRNFAVVRCRFGNFSFNPLNQVLFAWQLQRLKPNLVHFTMTGAQPMFYFGRQITMTHDLTMFEFTRSGRLPSWLHRLRMLGYRLLVWRAHRQAKRIIVPTNYVRDAVAKFHPSTKNKVRIVPEASEPPQSGKAEEPAWRPVGDFVCYVGSAFPHKNLWRLVKAFELVKKKHPALTLLLVGKREWHSRTLEEWVRRRGTSDVFFTGFVPDNELKWLYEHARAYVFPSLSEGFGLPGLEAMAHGCPVVSSDATCLPEVYGDAALYFDPRNTKDMAEKINAVLVDEELRGELINKGFKRAGLYSWQKMARQTLDVYREALADDQPFSKRCR